YKVTEKDFINNLEDIFAAMDQPTIDGINSYFISKCAHEEGLKAVLSGLGGDELFGGYPSFKRIEKCWFLRNVPGNAKKLFGLFEYFQNDKLNKLSFLSIDNPLSFYLLFRGLFPVRTVAKILDVEKKQIHDALEKLYFKENYDMGKYNFISYLESNLYMQNQLLKDTDYMSMWHSVEVRVPFLDKEFLNFVYSIDEDIKFNKKVPKGLLIKSFEDLIPKEIISRKKQGFGFPFQKWMRDNIDYISDFAQIDGNHAIKSVLNKFQCNSLHWSRFWSLVVLSQYKR
ncbi:asparagine synthase, partial [Marine Group I thaumarchaeote]|nr:asparagine synthase [Marine Group I thaumarchaeote]